MDKIIVTKNVERLMREHIQSQWPKEAVCLWLGTGGVVTEIRLCKNIAADPYVGFKIDWVDVVSVVRGELIALFHTHPGGVAELSTADKQYALPGVVQVVGSLDREGRLREVRGWKEEGGWKEVEICLASRLHAGF